MIRPIDLQNTLINAQNSPPAARPEPAARLDAQATAAAFAAEVARREEAIAPSTQEAAGTRIEEKREHKREQPPRQGKRHPATPFEELVDDIAGSSEEPAHIVDFTA
jgi:hypothetical protein